MSHYNVKPIRLDFKPSRLLVSILAAAGVGTCAILICMPLDGMLKMTLCLMVLLASSYHIMDKGLLWLPWSCIGLVLDAKGSNHIVELTVGTRSGAEQKITVLSNSFVASYLTVLNYQVEGKYRQRSILMLPDNVEADGFRQLRVWLRWARQISLATET